MAHILTLIHDFFYIFTSRLMEKGWELNGWEAYMEQKTGITRELS
jgi:hypothetical protein